MFDFFDGDEKVMKFRGSCGVHICAKLKSDLEATVAACSDRAGVWVLDFELVDRVDFAFIQMIVVFKGLLESFGGSVFVVNGSRSFVEAVSLFSLESDFGLVGSKQREASGVL